MENETLFYKINKLKHNSNEENSKHKKTKMRKRNINK